MEKIVKSLYNFYFYDIEKAKKFVADLYEYAKTHELEVKQTLKKIYGKEIKTIYKGRFFDLKSHQIIKIEPDQDGHIYKLTIPITRKEKEK